MKLYQSDFSDSPVADELDKADNSNPMVTFKSVEVSMDPETLMNLKKVKLPKWLEDDEMIKKVDPLKYS